MGIQQIHKLAKVEAKNMFGNSSQCTASTQDDKVVSFRSRES